MWFPLEIKMQRHGFLASPFDLHSPGDFLSDVITFHRGYCLARSLTGDPPATVGYACGKVKGGKVTLKSWKIRSFHLFC